MPDTPRDYEKILSTTVADAAAIYHLRLSLDDLKQMVQIAELSPMLQRAWIQAAIDYRGNMNMASDLLDLCPHINKLTMQLRTHEDTLRINLSGMSEGESMLIFGDHEPKKEFNGFWSVGEPFAIRCFRGGFVTMTEKDSNRPALISCGALRMLYRNGWAVWL